MVALQPLWEVLPCSEASKAHRRHTALPCAAHLGALPQHHVDGIKDVQRHQLFVRPERRVPDLLQRACIFDPRQLLLHHPRLGALQAHQHDPLHSQGGTRQTLIGVLEVNIMRGCLRLGSLPRLALFGV